MKKRQAWLGLGVALLILTVAGIGWQMPKRALADPPGSDPDAVAEAEETTQTLINALLAAVVSITESTDEDNVEANSKAVSLLVPDCQQATRLLDATGDPLDRRNRPRGRFERQAVAAAVAGDTTQEIRGNRLVTVVPLTFSSINCATCHDNYFEFDPDEVVGAAKISIPLN